MHTADPKNLIVALFEQLLDWHVPSPVQDTKNESNYGMAFTLDLHAENYGYELDGNTHHAEWERRYRKFIHLIVLRPRMCFVAVTETPYLFDVDPSLFKNTSNHDSCWRTDGLRILNNEANAAYEHCFGFMPEEHRKPPCYYNIDMDVARVFGKPFQFVCVEHKEEETPRSTFSRWRVLTSIKEAPYELRVLPPK